MLLSTQFKLQGSHIKAKKLEKIPARGKNSLVCGQK